MSPPNDPYANAPTENPQALGRDEQAHPVKHLSAGGNFSYLDTGPRASINYNLRTYWSSEGLPWGLLTQGGIGMHQNGEYQDVHSQARDFDPRPGADKRSSREVRR